VTDAARSCCESRYLHTDDDLDYLAGQVFHDLSVERVDDQETASGDIQEMAFLKIHAQW